MELVKYKCFGNATWTHKHISSRASASPNLNRASKVNKRGKKEWGKTGELKFLGLLFSISCSCLSSAGRHQLIKVVGLSQQYLNLQTKFRVNFFFERTALDECVSINIAENTRLRSWEAIGRETKRKRKKTTTILTRLDWGINAGHTAEKNQNRSSHPHAAP